MFFSGSVLIKELISSSQFLIDLTSSSFSFLLKTYPELYLVLTFSYLLFILATELGNGRSKKTLALESLAAIRLALILTFVLYGLQLFYLTNKNFENGYLLSSFFILALKGLTLVCGCFLLHSSHTYLARHRKHLLEYSLVLGLALLFMLLLIGSSHLLAAFLAVVGFSLNLYILILFDCPTTGVSREAGIKYYYLSAFSSGLMIYGTFLLFAQLQTGHFFEMSLTLSSSPELFFRTFELQISLFLFLSGIVFKLSAFPGHLWAPEVYEGSPDPVTAFFMLPVKIAVTAFLLRFLTTALEPISFVWQPFLIFSVLGSLFWGCFGSLFERKTKRFLAYASINQMGFILLGVSANSLEAYRSSALYLFVYATMNLGFLAIFLTTSRLTRQHLLYLTDFRAFGANNWFLSWTLVIVLFSMAGIPPLAGFFGKYYLLLHAQEQQLFGLVALALLTSLVSSYYYLRIIKILWFEGAESRTPVQSNIDRSSQFVLFLVEVLLWLFILFSSITITASSALIFSLFSDLTALEKVVLVFLSAGRKKKICHAYRAVLKSKRKAMPRLRAMLPSFAPILVTGIGVLTFSLLEIILTEEAPTFSATRALGIVMSYVTITNLILFSPFLLLFSCVFGGISISVFLHYFSNDPGFFWWKARYKVDKYLKNTAAINREQDRLRKQRPYILHFFTQSQSAQLPLYDLLKTEVSLPKWRLFNSCLRAFHATGASPLAVEGFRQKLLRKLFPSYVAMFLKHEESSIQARDLNEVVNRINFHVTETKDGILCSGGFGSSPPPIDLSLDRALQSPEPTVDELGCFKSWAVYRESFAGEDLVMTNAAAEYADAHPFALEGRENNKLTTDLTPVSEQSLFDSLLGPDDSSSASGSFLPFHNTAPSALQLEVASVPSNQIVFQVQQGFQPAVPLSNTPALLPTGPLPALPSGAPLALRPAPELPSRSTGGCWVDSLEAQRPFFFLESEHLIFLNDCFLILVTFLHIALIVQPSWFYIVLMVKLRYFQFFSYLSALKKRFW